MSVKSKQKKSRIKVIIFLLIIVNLTILSIVGIKILQIKQNKFELTAKKNKSLEYWKSIPTPTPEPTIDPRIPWRTYETSVVSFEYPSYMQEMEPYFDQHIPDMRSYYRWNVEHLSSGDYFHEIGIQIVGPEPGTESISVKDWLKNKYWPSEGIIHDMAGTAYVSTISIRNHPVIVNKFIVTNTKNPRNWTLYFKTSKGICYILVTLQGTEQEIAQHQDAYTHIVETLQIN